MKYSLLTRVLILACIISTLNVFPAFSQSEKMTYEDYVAVLQRWVEREEAARVEIEKLEADILALRGEIEATEEMIAAKWEEVYQVAAIDKQSISEFDQRLMAIDKKLREFDRLGPEAIYQRQAELESLNQELQDLYNHPEAVLTAKIDALDAEGVLYASIYDRMAKPLSKTYTVAYGDYLWKIAKMPKHYGDPMKWMRIYSANLDQIKDADLIYPDQRLAIPMSIDKKKQYLVSKGDYLYSIAESVYGDPFKWRRIYDNNRRLVEDPNLVYPETILQIHKN